MSDTFPCPGLLGALLCVCGKNVHSNRKNNLPFFSNQIIFKKMILCSDASACFAV
jgi:hypothetical protein